MRDSSGHKVQAVAGLIARAKTGRIVACRLTATPMEQAMDWLNRYQRFWSEKALVLTCG